MVQISDEVLADIEEVAQGLAPYFTFGFHTTEDIEQEARILCLEALECYDESRGAAVKTWLYTYVRSRLTNFKRDNFYRISPPCCNCYYCSNYEIYDSERLNCSSFSSWVKRNRTKTGLMEPESLEGQSCYSYSSGPNRLDLEEQFSIVNTHLHPSFRADFRRLLEDVHIPKNRRTKLINEIQKILEEYYGETWQDE